MKKTISTILSVLLAAYLLGGCGGAAVSSQPAQETTAASEPLEDPTSKEELSENSAEETENEKPDETELPQNESLIRVGSLKGPTSMGLVFLMEMAESGKVENSYEFTMVTSADELLPKVINGEVDIALVPANVASILYNRTKGQVAVIDINTLGVLYAVSSDTSIKTMADLKGKTIYMTGKGTTPDYVFRYLLKANGLSDADVTLEFKSEPTEVAALLVQEQDAIGVLPQPFVTVACAQNESLNLVLDLTAEWEQTQTKENKSQLVTGVTLVRRAFLDAHPEEVAAFLAEHEKSALYTKDQASQAAQLIVKTGIIEKAPIAEKALPYCNITCITGQEMKDALQGYLQVLFEQDAKSIGEALPEDDFYYTEHLIAD